ncbi:MAG: hypothetical protein ACJ8CR_18460 [Roseiflexaceae bacterium]|jgi:hypothetical protein
MKRVLLRRPAFQMLLPTGLLLIAAVLSIWAARELGLFLLVISPVSVGTALIVACAWARFRYEIRVGQVLHGYLYPPVLIRRIGIFSYTEYHIPLSDLRYMVVERPLRWWWCDGAQIALHFIDGNVIDLGVVSRATKGIDLLYTAMPLRTPTWNTVAGEYDVSAV